MVAAKRSFGDRQRPAKVWHRVHSGWNRRFGTRPPSRPAERLERPGGFSVARIGHLDFLAAQQARNRDAGTLRAPAELKQLKNVVVPDSGNPCYRSRGSPRFGPIRHCAWERKKSYAREYCPPV